MPLPFRAPFLELRRRRVFRAAGIYAVAAWVAVQVAATVFPILDLPAWSVRAVLAAAMGGFPIVLALAWAFDLEPTPPPSGLAGDGVAQTPRGARGAVVTRRLGLAAAVALLAGAGLWALRAQRARAAGAAPVDAAVAVFPFDVRAGRSEEYLREGMVSLLAARLDGAGGLRSTDPQALLRSVPGDPPGVEAAARLAARDGAGLFVLGSVVGGGGRIQVAASLYHTGDRHPLATASAEGPADSVFGTVDHVAMQLLSARRPGAPGAAVASALTTASLPAFKAYLEGEAALRELRTGPAVEAFARAVVIDTGFALAYSRLALAALWQSDDSLAAWASSAAAPRAARLPPRARALLAANLAFIHNERGAEAQYRTFLDRYPQEAEAWYMLGEVLFHRGGAQGRASTEARAPFEHALSLDPGNELVLVHLRELACVENRPGDLAALNPRGPSLDPANPLVNGTAAALAGPAAGRDAALRRLARAGDDELFAAAAYAVFCAPPDALAAVFAVADRRHRHGDPLARMFNLDLARGRWQAALGEAAAMRAGDPVSEILVRTRGLALPLIPHGRAELQRARADLRALDLSNLPGSARWADPLLARFRLGRIELALGDGRSGSAPLHIHVEAGATPGARLAAALYQARLNAHALAAGGHRVEALRALDALDARELVGGMSPGAVTSNDSEERWLRAELLREMGRNREALAMYGTFTGEMGMYWYVAPAELRIGQLRERLGEKRAAARAYRRFATLWHDADPAVQPLVHDAEARSAALER